MTRLRRDRDMAVLVSTTLAVLLGLIVLAVAALHATPARCMWCYSDTCLTAAQCGPDCACLFVGVGEGVCVGLDEGEE